MVNLTLNVYLFKIYVTCVVCVAVGAKGFDFSMPCNDYEKEVNNVAKFLLSHGVTSFCPTIISSPEETYREVRTVLALVILSHTKFCSQKQDLV